MAVALKPRHTADHCPELVVVQPLNREWKCYRCGGLLVMEAPGPACLRLGDLQFLISGDASLTRGVTKESARFAVVVRFTLVEADVLDLTRRHVDDNPRA